MKHLYKKRTRDFLLSALLILSILLVDSSALFYVLIEPNIAHAAQASIDTTVTATSTSAFSSHAQSVFVSETNGYKFYRDAGGTCVYSKTTDRGNSWGAAVTVYASSTCTNIAVWYDQWTPTLTGTTIHMVMMNVTPSKLFYNSLDTTGDTLSNGTTGTSTDRLNVQTGTYTSGVNYPAITEGTDGALYVGIVDSTDSFVLRCAATCSTSSNWAEAGANPFTNTDGDFLMLQPMRSGNVMVINRRPALATQLVQHKTWNGAAWSGAFTVIDGAAALNTTYDVGMSAAVASTTFDIYLGYVTDNQVLGTNDDIRMGHFNGNTWSTSTPVLNETKGLTGVAVGLNNNNNDIYLAYTGRTTAATANTGRVFWRVAHNGSITTFGGQNGPVNTAAGDLYGVDFNGVSDQRLFTSWYTLTGPVMNGDTIQDIAPGIMVTASTSQVSNVFASTTGQNLGGKFVIREMSNSRNITSVTVTASGTVNEVTDLSNVELRYDLDTTNPFNCDSETYGGAELQFGVDGVFSSPSLGTSTFTGSVAISTTSTMCAYVISDIDKTASSGASINYLINSPPTDIIMSETGEILPTTTVSFASSTAVRDGDDTQVHYHWREDSGTQASSSAATTTEDTILTNLPIGVGTRLRIEVSNRGSTSTFPTQYRLEYGTKQTSCEVVSLWTQVGISGADFIMNDSIWLADASNTTNIGTSTGGTSDDRVTFLTPNGGVRDVTSQTGNLVMTTTQFTELEFSIMATTTALDNTTYCFRLTSAGAPLDIYSVYPEVTMGIQRDFFTQRGSVVILNNTATITAGVNYRRPAASTTAFVRITNTQNTGGGSIAGTATQNANAVTAYIANPENILNNIVFQHAAGGVGNTRLNWEIVEYVGAPGGGNEIRVRQQQTMTYGTASTTASSSPASEVVDSNDVVVFQTGQFNPNANATTYQQGLSTAAWSPTSTRAVFTRGASGSAGIVSFAIVEFIGANWSVQRTEHAYTAAGAIETNAITTLNSISRAFTHVQKRATVNSHANTGHQVWISSVGQVSFLLNGAATTPAGHASVAWIVENTQNDGGEMVVTRSNGTQTGGAVPGAVRLGIGKAIPDVYGASMFMNNSSTGALQTFPEPMIAAQLISSSTDKYEIWMSNTGDTRAYRTEVVEWPYEERQITQNYYRIYENIDSLTPTTAWPANVGTLGENEAMTGFDFPMVVGDRARIRMSLNLSGSADLAPKITSFKLQSAKRSTTCSAVTVWNDIGNPSSTTAEWVGFNNPSVASGTALSINPPTGGDLLLSVSDRAGSYEENNNSTTTPYFAYSGEDIEYDWVVEDNLATSSASYCFRMIESDGSVLTAYNNYPTLKTLGYGVESRNWRWYDDAQNETPVTPLAGETISPIDVDYNNSIALRVTLRESNGAQGANAKFKLQFSESSVFATSTDVTGSTTCTNLSYWCYTPGGGTDGVKITTKTLTDSDACAASVGRGCGTHNSSSTSDSTYTQPATSSAEFSFIIRHSGARANRTYYFRAYDMVKNEPVEIAAGESYPSLTTMGSQVTFTVTGVATSTVTEGVTTDTGSTPTSIGYGSLPVDATRTAAYQLTVDANATEGYQILVYNPQELTSSGGSTIAPVSASNTAPVAWSTACDVSATGCFGYHVGDDTLSEGSTRFSPDDTYAALETTPREVAFSSVPVITDSTIVIYRVLARSLQPAGRYSTQLTYLIVPVF